MNFENMILYAKPDADPALVRLAEETLNIRAVREPSQIGRAHV